MASPRRFRWGFALLALILLGIVLWLIFHKQPAKAAKAPSVPVAVAKVSTADIPVSIDALGAAQPWQGVVINAQVNGRLTYVAQEGADVKAGQLIAQIDPSAYQAVLIQAQGALKRDTALLEAARVDLNRYDTLAAQDSIARQQRDTQAALVKQDEGVVLVDQGAVKAAQVNVNYCRITSPISGRVGVRLIDPGNVIAPSSSTPTPAGTTTPTTGIISIYQITPIAVTFTVPQGDFQQLSDASHGFSQPLTAQALSQDTGASLGTGELVVADNHVDANTGTVELKARFPNDGRALWPGQFVNVKLTLRTLPNATVIPAAAVNHGPKGAFAYVVGADNKVTARPITVVTIQAGMAAISDGLKLGETVVTDGQMSLKPGIAVTIHAAPATQQKPAA